MNNHRDKMLCHEPHVVGVSWNHYRNWWTAQVFFRNTGKRRSLGVYQTQIAAAYARHVGVMEKKAMDKAEDEGTIDVKALAKAAMHPWFFK